MKWIGKLLLLGIPALLAGTLLRQPQAVEKDYTTKLSPGGALEQHYTPHGGFAVEQYTCAADEKIGMFEVWYPSALKNSAQTWPVVIMANGTGVKASRYAAVFENLASWGFVVVGNEDESSWDGASTQASLEWILERNVDPDSIFCGRVDVQNIGAAGHSQGGVGAINAVTIQPGAKRYKALYTASATSSFWSDSARLNWPYDLSGLEIPYLMTAGTGTFDAGTAESSLAEEGQGIAPLWSLRENYAAVPGTTLKIAARRADADHGEMLTKADAVMTAWFCWQLQGDKQAAKMFCGPEAELLVYANWQDVEKNV
ncbi:MAG: alpha/beta hydrolase [Faecalibacterium sp.]